MDAQDSEPDEICPHIDYPDLRTRVIYATGLFDRFRGGQMRLGIHDEIFEVAVAMLLHPRVLVNSLLVIAPDEWTKRQIAGYIHLHMIEDIRWVPEQPEGRIVVITHDKMESLRIDGFMYVVCIYAECAVALAPMLRQLRKTRHEMNMPTYIYCLEIPDNELTREQLHVVSEVCGPVILENEKIDWLPQLGQIEGDETSDEPGVNHE